MPIYLIIGYVIGFVISLICFSIYAVKSNYHEYEASDFFVCFYASVFWIITLPCFGFYFVIKTIIDNFTYDILYPKNRRR